MTPEFDEYGIQVKKPRQRDVGGNVDDYGIPIKSKVEPFKKKESSSAPFNISEIGSGDTKSTSFLGYQLPKEPTTKTSDYDFTSKENAEGFREAINEKRSLPELVTDDVIKSEVDKHIHNATSKLSTDEKDPLGKILNEKPPEYLTKDQTAGVKLFAEKLKRLNNAFQTGDEAKEYLSKSLGQNVDAIPTEQLRELSKGNTTNTIAVNRLEKRRNVDKAFVQGGNQFEDAAIFYAANSGDENVKYLLEKGGGPMAIPPAVRDEAVLKFTMNPDVKQMAETNPYLKRQLGETIANFPVNHRDLATKLLADYIAKKRDEKGLNNAWANVVGKESTDKIVDEAIKNGDFPASYKFVYEKELRPKLGTAQSVGRGIGNAIPILNKAINDAPIPTPGLLENIEQGAEDTETGLSKSIVSLGGLDPRSKAEQTYDQLQKEYTKPEFEPTRSWQKMTMHGGQMVPLVASLVAGGEALQAANLIKSPTLANVTMMALATHGDNKDKALTLFPGNEMKQVVYTGVMDALNASMAKFLPGQQIGKLLKGETNVVADAIKSMVDGKISTDQAKNKILNILGNTIKGTVGGAEFSGAIAGSDDLLS